jgi:hypothetical protein
MLLSSLATFDIRLPLRDLLATLATCHALPAARAGDLASFIELTGDAEEVMLERRFREGERAPWARDGLWARV